MRHILLLVCLVTVPASLGAQPAPTTRLIPYAGIATDGSGLPLAGVVSVGFGLYEEQDGGAPLWRETQRVQSDERGRYLVYLGSVTPVPQIAFTEERARWLAVTVEDRPQPRVMLVAVPYALRAADADTLGGQPASAFVRSRADGRLETSAGVAAASAVEGSGVPGQLAKFSSPTTLSSSVISESASNRIGVGLPDPTGGGVVDSVFTIRNFDNNTGFAVLNQSQQRRFALNTSGNGSWILYDGANGVWNPGLRQRGGRIGIGVADPSAELDVSVAFGNAGTFSMTGDFFLYALAGMNYGFGAGVLGLSLRPTSGIGVQATVQNNAANTLFLGSRQTTSGEVNAFRVNALGNVFAASYTVGGADFAEEIDPVQPLASYEPGDVMIIGHGTDRAVDRSDQPYATTVLGVYSTQPGIVASPHSMDDPNRIGKLPVAMIGIVPCKVSAENGAIARGDLLVTSATPGHAMKGTDRARMTGAIVGKALAPLASGTGQILVAVTLQ